MTDSNEISSLYPQPPPYIKFFTDENIQKASELSKKGPSQAPPGDNSSQKSPLSYLLPPELPDSGIYRAFGNVWHIKDQLPQLSQLGIEELYQNTPIDSTQPDQQAQPVNYENKIQELKKLLKSLLLNFLELVGVLGINPDLYTKKLDEIRIIAINIHHLLNEYRPHQSRESLIMLLEEQLDQKRKEVEQIIKQTKQVETTLNNL